MFTKNRKLAADRRVENRASAQARGATRFYEDGTLSILEAAAETGVPVRTIEGYTRGGLVFALAGADGVLRVSNSALDTIRELYSRRRAPSIDSSDVMAEVRA